jgi:hypothetical protein
MQKGTNLFLVRWSGSQIISKLSDLHINPTTFQMSIYPAYKSIKAHAERVMKEKEETTAHVSEHGSSQENTRHTLECVTTWGLRNLDGKVKMTWMMIIDWPHIHTLFLSHFWLGLFMVFRFLFQEGVDRSADYSMALIKKIHKASNFVKGIHWWKTSYAPPLCTHDPLLDASWVFKLGFW